MKALLVVLAVFAISILASPAEDYRKWTEESSGRVIEAKISDKAIDNSRVRLNLVNGKVVWMEAARLVEADRVYIRSWIKPMKHITARVTSSGKGYKNIHVKVIAGSHRLTVKAFNRYNGKPPLKKSVPAGGQIEFHYKAKPDYRVRAFHGKKLVDEESSMRKTGLGL